VLCTGRAARLRCCRRCRRSRRCAAAKRRLWGPHPGHSEHPLMRGTAPPHHTPRLSCATKHTRARTHTHTHAHTRTQAPRTHLSSLNSGWSPDAGSMMARRSCARKQFFHWYMPDLCVCRPGAQAHMQHVCVHARACVRAARKRRAPGSRLPPSLVADAAAVATAAASVVACWMRRRTHALCARRRVASWHSRRCRRRHTSAAGGCCVLPRQSAAALACPAAANACGCCPHHHHTGCQLHQLSVSAAL
jgi:hypothetical protein